MGRPSIRQLRQEQILDAYQRCVIKYGFEGATLQRIADEAGLARPLVRHHLGNRDVLQAALIERYVAWSRETMEQMIESLPEKDPASALLDYLFFDTSNSNTDYVLLWEALVAAARNDPALSQTMSRWIMAFVEAIENIIRAQFPDSEYEDINEVATGITGIYFNTESVSIIGTMSQFRMASYNSANRLLSSL